ncbi:MULTISPECIES: MerR family transcriptional regulator [Amycolatopsis]|uniref:DNA-binding transcriptional regulator, MerR family n=2 Tax=Amycolatopsis TaxID=1813 RepID=A0A1I3S014_9PSEU|nr:MerR family transcriptional regulator [Amycolatopsis sacchari]SFJ50891.1 DNA-binding transcriptional regulator, MerR family [Amycolatopsis sacchari]
MWSIGEVAAKLGLAVSALRYWDERGLVRPVGRRAGKRVYGEPELHRLAVAKLLQDTGLLSLDEISALLHGPGRGEDWRAAVRGRLDTVREQQAVLDRAADFLEHFLDCPREDPVASCPELRALTEKGHRRRGAGGLSR